MFLEDIAKYIHHKWIDGEDKWFPFLSVFYLTYACDFRCGYCSDGSGTPYHKLRSEFTSGSFVLEILKKIRRYSTYLVITGGEPLNHPHFSHIVRSLSSFKFQEVVLTTNGYELDRFLEDIAKGVDSLVISIDALNPRKADSMNGTPPGTFNRILHNVELAKESAAGNYQIIISSVITPNNMEDLYNVYRYADENGFVFAACPQLIGVNAHEALRGSGRYKRFYDFLLSEKKKGGRIHGTAPYLETMRDLKNFQCHPFTMLTVSPEGDIFYPCLEIGHFVGNILDGKNLHEHRRSGAARFGPLPDCGVQCHSACALGFSTILEHPFSMVQEAFLWGRDRVFGYFY